MSLYGVVSSLVLNARLRAPASLAAARAGALPSPAAANPAAAASAAPAWMNSRRRRYTPGGVISEGRRSGVDRISMVGFLVWFDWAQCTPSPPIYVSRSAADVTKPYLRPRRASAGSWPHRSRKGAPGSTSQQDQRCQAKEDEEAAAVGDGGDQHAGTHGRIAPELDHERRDEHAEQSRHQQVQRHRGGHHQAERDAVV